MSFDFSPLCGAEPRRPTHRIATILLPLGAVAALLPWTPPWAALLGGTALSLSLGNPCAVATTRAAKWLLQIAVIGLGAAVNLAVVGRVGLHGIGYTLVGLLVTFVLGAWLARRLTVRPKIATLISAGTGICGGSAIAAISPAINATVAETSASLATVFLLNGVALLVFPAIGGWVGLDAHRFGLWCALAIHDTSSVAGAAMTHGAEALATATTVKLARALWIVPVALGLGAWFGRGIDGPANRRRVRIPWFIAGFVALSALFTLFPQWRFAAHGVAVVSQSLLTLTLFFIGAGLDRRALDTVGVRPFLLGMLLWIAIASMTLAALLAGWIR